MSARITLKVEYGPLAGEEHVFTERRTCLIGRAEDCDLRLPNGPGYCDVSRHHCLLHIDPPNVWVRDLGSRNGTRLNGREIGHPAGRDGAADGPPVFLPSYELRDGDELLVGHTAFRVRGAVPADAPPVLVAGEGAASHQPRAGQALSLGVTTAAEMMTPHIVSIAPTATALEAAALLTDKGVTAVPVVGADGRAVGVLSRTDLVAHDCEGASAAGPADDKARPAPAGGRVLTVEKADETRVGDVMTQFVFAVAPTAPAAVVVDAMLSLAVHRLFVTDGRGAIVGVISTTDVLRHLRPATGPVPAGPVPAAAVSPVCLISAPA
jgi:CBS domain-containing protein